MSALPPSPHGPPPPGSPIPSSPSPAGGRRLPWIIGAGVLALVVVVVVVVAAFAGGNGASDARSVQDVADLAVEAAEDLDIDAGVDLLCAPPSSDDRAELDRLIERGQEETGSEDPDVDYDVSEVEGDAEGSFRVTLRSDEVDEERDLVVQVRTDGDRSCIDAEATADSE